MLDEDDQRPKTFRVIATMAATFYSLFCLIWILINRIYFKAYYLSTNAAVIGVFLGALLLFQSAGLPLGIWLKLWPRPSRWRLFADVVMFFLWLANLLLFFVYAAYSGMRPTVNRDAVIAACSFVINFFILLSSRIMTVTARKSQGFFYSAPNEDHEVRTPRRRLLTIPVVLGFLLYGVLVLGTLYEVICKIRDWNTYRPTRHMFQVRMAGHLPLFAYLRCEGNSSHTILMEEGMIGSALMAYEFVPAELAKSHRVCFYDRLGAGWSDSIESDKVSRIHTGLNSAVHRTFIRSLILTANLSRPLVLAGHGMGGWHITLYALAYPEDVEGLIYINGARFWANNSAIPSVFAKAAAKANVLKQFNPTGWPRILAEIRPGLVAANFLPYIDWKEISKATQDEILATLFGGSFFAESLNYEKFVFLKQTPKAEGLVKDLSSMFRVLVIDSAKDWFPRAPGNVSSNYTFVHFPNSTHLSLFYSKTFAKPVAREITKFLDKKFF